MNASRKNHMSLCSLVVCACLSAHQANGQDHASAARPALLVVNQGDASLSIVEPLDNRQIATISEEVPSMVGHEVATSPDGHLAYLPLYGDSGVGKPGSDGRTMLVIDLATHQVIDHLDFGHGVRPHCVVYDRRSNLLYVTTELDKSVTIIDPHTMKIVGTIPTTQEQSHMLTISHDGRHGYTANVGPGTVSVLDLVTRRFVTTIPIAASTQRISISNDDRMVFTSDQTKPRLAVIDTSTNKVTSWVELPDLGYGSAPTTDGRLLLVTMPSAGALEVVDLKSMKAVRTIKVGDRPQEVLVQPDGMVAYVSCFGGHQVAVVDLSQWRVTAMIDVGKKADGMAWAGN
jgi:DNA-binding beta-propeller fold protein YncE